MSQNAFEYIYKENSSRLEAKVFHFPCVNLDYQNLIQMNLRASAKAIEVHHVKLSDALRRLHDLAIMLKCPGIGIHRTCRFNPHIGWKGRTKKRISRNSRAESHQG